MACKGKTKLVVSISALLALLVYHLAIVNIYTDYVPQFSTICQCLAVIIGVILFTRIKIFVKKEYLGINLLLLVFFCVIIYSSLQGQRYMSGYWLNSLMYAVTILEIFLCMEYFNYQGRVNNVLNMFYYLTLFYCVLGDVLMIVYPHYTELSFGEKYYYYFLGDKFDTSYFHLFLIILFCVTNKVTTYRSKLKLTALIALFIWVAIMSECTTALLGGATLFIFYLAKPWFNKLSRKPIVSIIYIAICNSFLLVNTALLSVPAIKYVIENVLNESVTLTGRTNIYLKMYSLVNMNLLWGYGYDNNYSMSMEYTGAGDVQNGIFDCLVSYGIIGTGIMLFVVVFAIKKGAKKTHTAWLGLLFAFITMSMVEITFRRMFFVVLAFVAFGWNYSGNKRLADDTA